MEILLLIAIVAVGAAGLYVAATFNKRTEQNFDPLIKKAEANISREVTEARAELLKEVQAASGELRQQAKAHAARQQSDGELRQGLDTAFGELRQQAQARAEEARSTGELLRGLAAASDELRQQVQAITNELRRNSELVKHLDEQADARQSRLAGELAHLGQLERQVAKLSESLGQQSSRISGIYRHFLRQEMAAGSPGEDNSLLLAMLEAESYVDDQGWGGRPRLYALTEKVSTGAAGGDELELVDQGPLPDGDLSEALAGVHWQSDVVGCVLVAELAALAPRGEAGAPLDPAAAGQWASSHPDGRAARLAIGFRRNGAHECGLRIKGEDELQIRADLAADLVAALARTF
jgi:hypothetical protein